MTPQRQDAHCRRRQRPPPDVERLVSPLQTLRRTGQHGATHVIPADTIEQIIAIVRADLPDVVAIYLFGSRVHGAVHAESDYDIAFLPPRAIDPLRRFDVQERLASRLRASVDLVDLRRASTVLAVQVLEHGELLHDGNRFERQLYEATTLADYARLNEERGAILRDIEERGRVHG